MMGRFDPVEWDSLGMGSGQLGRSYWKAMASGSALKRKRDRRLAVLAELGPEMDASSQAMVRFRRGRIGGVHTAE